MDWLPVALGLTAAHLFLMMWAFSQLNIRIQLAFEELDGSLAAAIQESIKKLMAGELKIPEPVNPLQAALANLLMNKAQEAPIVQTVMERGPDGKFSG